MAYASEFGLRVALLRDKLGMNQKDLGLALGFAEKSAQSSISKLELGKQTIDVLQLVRLAAVLQVSVADLFMPTDALAAAPARTPQQTPLPMLTAEVLDLARAGAQAPSAVVVAATHLIRELSAALAPCPMQ